AVSFDFGLRPALRMRGSVTWNTHLILSVAATRRSRRIGSRARPSRRDCDKNAPAFRLHLLGKLARNVLIGHFCRGFRPAPSLYPLPPGLRYRGARDRQEGRVTKSYRIAAIPGDGIGREVVPAGIGILEAAARRHGFTLAVESFDWSCERFARTGRMMPEDGLERLRSFDAIYLGAVGYPGVPD